MSLTNLRIRIFFGKNPTDKKNQKYIPGRSFFVNSKNKKILKGKNTIYTKINTQNNPNTSGKQGDVKFQRQEIDFQRDFDERRNVKIEQCKTMYI